MSNLNQLVDKVTNELRSRHLQIATAESCTGGLIAGLLTELPGSSNWFERGFVTYSNLAKEEMLGIKSELIQRHGAVSEQVAEAMALGALQYSAADLSLAVTGIAGPDGGSSEKPVGTVCFAWAMRDFPVITLRCHFSEPSRQKIREKACIRALEGIISVLK
ncbi:CinA family protein [Legionella jordanis]|uniref:CinA-like competence damage protein n=1 Tax=Legionella jordanis TaxID=456 RepID=A0A0W0V9H5_9GAMM|nr:CinA family protein [Legionella jordanis]KTD16518.1 CinA-like competence damage protein [Legionella jordanis]RMX03938.1 CinA family protein [Legionella jordanis]RMX21993.1 CinA family protein [Legionella jordanis]VEH12021.1 putative 17.2kDa protein, CinA-related competence damage protein [Legionella jordanis]HAT8712677.1 nicotinamide-nucleotide amidohydrolase family protein [Legionella jordanis]